MSSCSCALIKLAPSSGWTIRPAVLEDGKGNPRALEAFSGIILRDIFFWKKMTVRLIFLWQWFILENIFIFFIFISANLFLPCFWIWIAFFVIMNMVMVLNMRNIFPTKNQGLKMMKIVFGDLRFPLLSFFWVPKPTILNDSFKGRSTSTWKSKRTRHRFPLTQNFFEKSLADREKIKPAEFR